MFCLILTCLIFLIFNWVALDLGIVIISNRTKKRLPCLFAIKKDAFRGGRVEAYRGTNYITYGTMRDKSNTNGKTRRDKYRQDISSQTYDLMWKTGRHKQQTIDNTQTKSVYTKTTHAKASKITRYNTGKRTPCVPITRLPLTLGTHKNNK